MSRCVGVELDGSSVRVLALEISGKRPQILQSVETPVPEDERPWEERTAEALREAFASGKIPKGPVAASIESGEAILRDVSIPFKTEDQIRRTARYEIESQIHNYTIEQLVVAHYKTAETEKGSLLLAAAVPKEIVGRTLRALQGAGLDPVSVDLDVSAVYNALRYVGAIDAEQPHLIVHGTAKFTKLVFVEQGQPRSIRTIRFSLQGNGDLDGPDPKVRESLVEILAKEISRFLLANVAGSSPAHILLTGTFEDPEAAKRLDQATGIPVRTVPLKERFILPDKGKRQVRIGAPLGLALKAAGADTLGMDFRQDEFSYRRKFEPLKTASLVALELLIVLLAAVALHFYFLREEILQARSEVVEEQRLLYEEEIGEKLENPEHAFVEMTKLLNRYQGPAGKGLPLKRSARETWISLYETLKKFHDKYSKKQLGEAPLHLEIESIDIRQNLLNKTFEINLRGKIRNLEYAGALKTEIRSDEFFKDAEYVGQIRPLKEGDLYQFHLRASRDWKRG